MNLILRLVRVILAALLGRRRGLLDESVLEFRVWPHDLDLNLHMNNGRYLTIMDLGRTDVVIRSGLLGVSLRRRWMPALGGASVRFRRSLGPFERFRLRTRLLYWDEKWFYFEQIAETMDGRLACAALVKGVLRGPNGTVPSAEILDALGIAHGTRPVAPPAIAAWIAAEEDLHGRRAA
ncbi:thioesterase family protein [Arenibaculum pallidiluteum]|uniref:thioesterase family protein n=1 Tax=Arenibaculum pallidiluteum TaxID=2812559 RepID=UPI001A967F86|nr:thioesterase family protein [Arenibaculum pallidiluteum]